MPQFELHNSMTRRREPFVPLDPAHVRLYVCGPTVYDLAHVGNARGFTVFDVLVRLLRLLYPQVTHVRNITDVDDKINARAAETGESIAEVTARTGAQFAEDMAALGNLPPDREPRATEHVAEMITLIELLIARGHAYAAQGHVLFAVSAFASYGALSGRSPDELLAGARVEIAPYKRDPGDFVLWKPSPPELPGWDSPWGRGRPGWHIECSAMSWRYLGETFDIHGGGGDLIFPHHENERAQSLCALPGSGFARYWMHWGMVTSGGEKMSKSLGNFYTIREVRDRAPGEAIRLLLLRAQYRSQLEFSFDGLREAQAELDRFYRALQRTPPADAPVPDAVLDVLCDDVNTPAAFAILHELAGKAMAGDPAAASGLKAAGSVLGLLQQDPAVWFQGGIDAGQVEAAIAERIAARKVRDFAGADAIRAEWLARGVAFEDRPDGSTGWRRVAAPA
ncbi:MAG: cysteine--tRNA ligase [Acetobacteraceae bacterium]|nr:cysteine--tRNA ligase [Acetobacteraceae bacterium]